MVPEHDARIGQVERGLVTPPVLRNDPPQRVHLLDCMCAFAVPRVSVAVVGDHEIRWRKGYGGLGYIWCFYSREPGEES